MSWKLYTIVLVLLHVWPPSASSQATNGTKDLYIIGLFGFSGSWPGGPGCYPAARMALRDVNARPDILPGYRLVMHWNDTKCQGGVATNVMFEQLYRPPTKIMILGAGCSIASEPTAMASHQWNLVQISYSSVSPALSDKTTFPRFLRTYPPESATNPAKVILLNTFNWRRVAFIDESFPIFAQTSDHLISLLAESNITVLTSELFSDDPTHQVLNLKFHNSQCASNLNGYEETQLTSASYCAKLSTFSIPLLGVGNFTGTTSKISMAYKVGLYGPRYVWFIIGWYANNFWRETYPDVNCTALQLEKVLEGSLAVSQTTLNPEMEVGIAGMTSAQFQERFLQEVKPHYYGVNEGPTTYDAVWTMAVALNETQTYLKQTGFSKGLEDFQYNDTELADLILRHTWAATFVGVTGQVYFDEHGDSPLPLSIDQMQEGQYKRAGIYLPAEGDIIWEDEGKLRWPGGSVPKDSTTYVYQDVYVSRTTYIAVCFLAGVSIIIAAGLLVFNIHFRNYRLIKMSSPVMNNIILAGCVVTHLTVFLREQTSAQVALMCRARTMTVMLGFSLAFGALFAKTWRVYIIFTNTTKKVVLRDSWLVLMVAVLVLVDVAIFLIWEFADPRVITRETVSSVPFDGGDLVIERRILICTSTYDVYTQIGIYVFKGLLLVFGSFLAWQTRKVSISGLNDSHNIGMCIYNVTVLSILGVVLAFSLSHQVELQYVLTSTFLIVGTVAIQLIIFLPKVVGFKLVQTQVEDRTHGCTVDGMAHTITHTPGGDSDPANLGGPAGTSHIADVTSELEHTKARLSDALDQLKLFKEAEEKQRHKTPRVSE